MPPPPAPLPPRVATLVRPDLLTRAAGDLVDLVLPRTCAGCGRAGTSWCRRCAGRLEGLRHPGGPVPVTPDPTPPGYPRTWAWGRYAPPLTAVVTGWKDRGRRDLDAALAPRLDLALSAALSGRGWAGDPFLVVPAPSSPGSTRRRGEAPLTRVVRGLDRLRDPGPGRLAPALAVRRVVADQSGLGAGDRAANLAGALVVPDAWERVVAGRRCLVVDDVTTTGATLAECARALTDAGALGVVGAVVAATERLRAGPGSRRL